MVVHGGEQLSVAAGVIISNHVSWADILVHMEGHFCSFVARSNTQDMPLIGLIRFLHCLLHASWLPNYAVALSLPVCMQPAPGLHLCDTGVCSQGP